MNSLGIDKPPGATLVVAAMSGGVDSSVCAALLKEEGYEVIGATMHLFGHEEAGARPNACCSGRDARDAAKVADVIGIPHYVLDFEKRFREAVIDDFAGAYLKGETPNPCIRCNQTVKFTDLLQKAKELGADILATGHYARQVQGSDGPELHRAADPVRDQSYFLFATTSQQLQKIRFPLGAMGKDKVRKLARRFRLPVADKPDSQDLCFAADGKYGKVVKNLRPDAFRPGDIVHVDGQILGRHRGIANFTVGQRRGLGVSGGEPLYVIRLDLDMAAVTVGPKEALYQDRLLVRDLNWLGQGELLDGAIKAMAKLRSTSTPAAAAIRAIGGGKAEVIFAKPQAGVAPGQACVFYDQERVLGGGWIIK